MSKGEPSHADLTHALRFAIKLAEAEGYSECADDLRAVLAHLERTQPTDPQADLTEREPRWVSEGRKRVAATKRIMVGSDIHLIEMAIMAHDKHEAALQSEREAALMDGGEWPHKARGTDRQDAGRRSRGAQSGAGRSGTADP